MSAARDASVALAPAARRDPLDRFWDAFASLGLTIPLLGALAFACIVGTFTSPQAIPLAEVRKSFGTGVAYALIRAFELNDLFHSWWFSLVLVAVTLNLVACSVERLPRIWRLAMRPDRRLSDRVLGTLRHQARFDAQGEPEAEVARLSAILRGHGFQPGLERAPDGTLHLYAERGRTSRFGVHVVHFSFLVVLLGGLVGRMWGYDGNVTVAEGGGTFDFVFLKASDGTPYRKPLGFAVRVDDFRLLRFANGAPKSFESDLVVFEGGREVARQTIAVNRPLHHGGWAFYQSSYEQAEDRSWVKLTFTDRETGRIRTRRVQAGEPIAMDGGEVYEVLGVEPRFRLNGPAVHIARTARQASTDFWVVQGRSGFDLDDRGDRWGIDFEGLEDFYFTGLQVARDPGANVVFLGCLTLFLGLLQAFYTSHRRVWARVRRGEVVLAGSAHKNREAFDKVFEALVQAARGGAAEKG